MKLRNILHCLLYTLYKRKTNNGDFFKDSMWHLFWDAESTRANLKKLCSCVRVCLPAFWRASVSLAALFLSLCFSSAHRCDLIYYYKRNSSIEILKRATKMMNPQPQLSKKYFSHQCVNYSHFRWIKIDAKASEEKLKKKKKKLAFI